MGYFTGSPRDLPDQPVPAVDPEVERLARVLIDGLIARLAAEPAVPAVSLLDNLGDQLQQAANLRRLGVVRRRTADPGRHGGPTVDRPETGSQGPS